MSNYNCEDSLIKIRNFNLSYGNVTLFSNFDFFVPKGKSAGIFGPTGRGKTSLLNKIVDNYVSKNIIAYVFQDNKLIENLTVAKNVMLPLEKSMGKADAEKKAREILEIVRLEEKFYDKVSVLSGGERQRVNLARAFCYLESVDDNGVGKILLMDEAFSAQDFENREKLIEVTKKICSENDVTSIIVSHNRDDLDNLCDFVVEL